MYTTLSVQQKAFHQLWPEEECDKILGQKKVK
jgi:hypothetical protein